MLRDWPFYRNSFEELLQILQKRIIREEKTFLVTANPVIVMHAQRDLSYKNMLFQADFITTDGIGIVKACKWLGIPLMERITGFDLMESLIQLANQAEWKVYLLGASPEVVSLAKANINKKYPRVKIVGCHHGYFDSSTIVIEEIKRVDPDLIFVGMGCPRQEKWISENIKEFRKGLYIGIGGSLDVLSGKDKRAPKNWINCHLEWLYRIIRKPKRVYVLKELCFFLRDVVREWIVLKLKKRNAKELTIKVGNK